MLLKTYRAPDLASALQKARAELGPEALVLGTREVGGLLGLKNVELTVGVDRAAAAGLGVEPDRESTVQRLFREIDGIRRALRGLPRHALDTAAGPVETDTSHGSAAEVRPGTDPQYVAEGQPEPYAPVGPPEPEEPPPAATTGDALNPTLAAAARALVASGLSSDLAVRFASIAAREIPPAAGAREIAAATERGVAGIVSFAPIAAPGGCVFVVGPPGAGKTTTAVKLAARIMASSKRPVCIAETDPNPFAAIARVGAVARRVGARVARVTRPADLQRARAALGPSGTLLVDTPGLGSRDDARMSYLLDLRRAAPDAGVALVLPAGLHHAEAARVVRRFEPLGPSCAVFSRVDDGGRIGELVTAIGASGLPLSCVTNGRGTPDLEDASARALAALLLNAGLTGATPEEMHR